MTANAVFLQFRRSASVALVLVLAVLQGCAAMSRPRAMPDDPEYAPVLFTRLAAITIFTATQ